MEPSDGQLTGGYLSRYQSPVHAAALIQTSVVAEKWCHDLLEDVKMFNLLDGMAELPPC